MFGNRKPGKDRRLQLRNKDFDKNMHRKLDGEEIPVTRRVSGAKKSPFECNITELCFCDSVGKKAGRGEVSSESAVLGLVPILGHRVGFLPNTADDPAG